MRYKELAPLLRAITYLYIAYYLITHILKIYETYS